MITSVNEDFQARETDVKMTLSPFKIVNTHKRRFVVITNRMTDDGILVSSAAGIPKPFDQHPNDATAYVNDINAKPRQGHPTCWEVLVSYLSDMPSPSGQNKKGSGAPAMPTQYSKSFTTMSRVLERDLVTGHPVVNSAGEKFDPPLQYDIYLDVYTAAVPGQQFDDDNAITGCVNLNQFTINGVPIGENTALARVRQTPYFQGGQAYWTTNYGFTIKPDGWAIAPLDQGTRKISGTQQQIDGGDGFLVTITDKFNQPLNRPVNLNGSGQPLPPGANPVYLDGTHGLKNGIGDQADIKANGNPQGPGGFNCYETATFPNV